MNNNTDAIYCKKKKLKPVILLNVVPSYSPFESFEEEFSPKE